MKEARGPALSGALDFDSVPGLLHRAGEFVQAGALDLGGVTRADSAGLAFLLELTRRAKKAGRAVAFRGAPAQIRDLARFFGVEGLLQFDSH